MLAPNARGCTWSRAMMLLVFFLLASRVCARCAGVHCVCGLLVLLAA